MRVCTVCQEPVPAGMPVCPRDGGAAEDPNDEGDSLTGHMVGEYKLKGIIGEGGMGQVYEGYQPVIGKRVAIKLLRRELAADKAEAARLLSEARTVNAIGHRGIIDIFSFGALPDGRQYFVMEYLSGVSLSQHIRQNSVLPIEDTLKLLDEMLAALGAAHGAGVIHRDFKPSNIFLVSQPDGTSYVKLLDFGIAKQAAYARGETPQTRVSRVMGTPEFMAPEQARGQPVGPRTDLYALGVVAFQMLTGELVFDADNPFELVNMHLSEEPPAPSSLRPEVPPEVDSLVLSLLEKDPANRPPSAEAVREQLKRLRKTLNFNATRLAVAPTAMSVDTLEAVASPASEEDLPSIDTRDTPVAPAPARRNTNDETRIAQVPPKRGPVPETRIIDSAAIARRSSKVAVPVSVAPSPAETQTVPEAVMDRPRGLIIGLAALALVLLISVAIFYGTRREEKFPLPQAGEGQGEGSEKREIEVTKDPEPVVAAVVEEPKPEPTPEPAPTVEEPKVTPIPTVAKKADPLTSRFRRVQGAWSKTRNSRSAEDRRIFDVMLSEVGKQLDKGSRADAAESLNDFVAGALNGKEP